MRSLWLGACVMTSGCFAVQGSGVLVEEHREVGAFEAVRNTVNLAVEVVEGDGREVLVRCDDNLIDRVQTEVRGRELRVDVRPNTSLAPRADCVVEVTTPTLVRLSASGSGETVAEGAFPDLEEVANSGSGRLRLDGVEARDLHVESSGSGGMVVVGSARSAEVDDTGSGDIDAMDLVVDRADVRNTGSGGIGLTVLEHASVRLTGSGNVRIAGRPRVDVDDSGSGRVVVVD